MNASPSAIVGDLVRRARLGDQNAMAMISEVRKAAVQGKPKALRSLDAIRSYCEKNPASKKGIVVAGTRIGADAPPASNGLARFRATTSLANGPLLSKTRLRAMAHALTGEDRPKAFLYGCSQCDRPDLLLRAEQRAPHAVGALRGGAAAGKARSIQMARRPEATLFALSPMVAWELGE